MSKCNFVMHVALTWIVNDFIAYGDLIVIKMLLDFDIK